MDRVKPIEELVPPWTEDEWIWALNQIFGDGELDEKELATAWQEALDHEGTPVEIGGSGQKIEVFPGAADRLRES